MARSLTALVRRTERPARIDNYADVSGKIGDAAREAGVHTGVGAPIVLDGRVWGVVSAGGGPTVRLPDDAETRTQPVHRAPRNRNREYPSEEKSCIDSPTSSLRCGGWPRWSRRAHSRPSSSMQVCQETGRLFDVSKRQSRAVHQRQASTSPWLAGASTTSIYRPVPASHWRGTASTCSSEIPRHRTFRQLRGSVGGASGAVTKTRRGL
jgi:hypothetical protein